MGLGAFANRYPHMLSGGQRKRVGLAQVLIRDPKILLMDEPFGPLDAQTRQIMGNVLLELWNADRKAVLFVTHDLEEAIALADRVVIMSAGPSARIIGDWRVTLPRPRDISEVRMEKEFHELHREIWSVLKDEVMKGMRSRRQAGPADVAFDTTVAAIAGGGRCARAVAVPHHRAGIRKNPVAAVLLLDPVDVASQIVKWFSSGVIWKHLIITLLESVLAFAIGSVGGVLVGFWSRASRSSPRCSTPMSRWSTPGARGAGADLRAVAGSRHLVQGCARRDAGVLHRVLQRLSGRQGGQPTVLDNGRMFGMSERQLTRRVLAVGAVVDVFVAAHGGRLCRGRRGGRRISGIGGRPRLFDPAGRRRFDVAPCSPACSCCRLS